MTTHQPARGSTRVLRPHDTGALADVPARVRSGLAGWLRSPALDFAALLVIGTLLISIGVVMVFSSAAVISIAKGESPYTGLISQGRFALIGLPLLAVAAMTPPAWYRRSAWVLLGIGLALQMLVHTPLGTGAYGNRNWILIGGMTFQPSEVLKLALAVWLGAILAGKRHRLHRTLEVLLPVVPVVMLALGLVVLGNDLGTTMVMCMLVAGALWVAGVPRRWFVVGGGLGGLAVAALVLVSGNRMARIGNWLHGTCEGDSCLQTDRGLQALAEGGWWGVGLGESRQKWGLLPAAQDDFIFAIIGEELGLVGTLGLLTLFVLLALVMLRMISRVRDPFVQITVGGVCAWLLGQAFVNMMVVTGLLPVLGVPLPFISSGGSALLASMLALGMLLSFARHEPGAKEAIGARLGTVKRTSAVHAAPAPRTSRTAPRVSGRAAGRTAGRTSGRASGRPSRSTPVARTDSRTASRTSRRSRR
ncbi:putative lipid II flippase FtsW [Brachybacterium sp. EF45031]|uniref:putative lipid II flippase FtsW n=1 Tax=Brachybacterium sillae TaxID=2810536 RepID=UPI00217D20FE|nr:putative lipid II flippase FtsW [Brachybacterium sillae]MCS6712402.1 putative lipid II flippase FtsW [Brachybacterium sillae]